VGFLDLKQNALKAYPRRQGELLFERRRLPDAGREGSAAPGIEIFQADAEPLIAAVAAGPLSSDHDQERIHTDWKYKPL
jgi:hypothetical protein